MLRALLILFATVVFALVALTVIDQNVVRWEAGALAALAASFFPFSDLPITQRRNESGFLSFAALAALARQWPHYKKAIGGFLAVAIPELAGLITLGLLSGPIAHDIGVILIAGGPLWAFFGVKSAPANIPKP